MNIDKLIRASSAVDLCMKKAKGYQPEMFGSDQECYTAKVVAMELAGEIRNLPATDTEALKAEIEALKRLLANEKALTQHTYECAEVFRNKAERLEKELEDVKRQRDAAINEAPRYCQTCNRKRCIGCKYASRWEWRGPCKENGGVDDGK